MKNQNKPIAIVGMGCRFPGSSSSPEKFWKMLLNETDGIIDVPSDRWDNRRFYDENENKPGKIRAKQGGFLKEKIKDFDPLFFGISPVEAESLDPQERILLEVAYEAFEDAGVSLDKIKGSNTGVFMGGFTLDNYSIQTSKENRHLINSHTAVGLSMTMLSNRLSYFFDLKGPSITIDTACSSSLVATHYACQSIWRGESSMALVGGVNALLRPEVSLFMSKGQFLSKHSRCKTFDSDAGGYVRGEGGGAVILKPYEDALKDGDRVYALIKGTGVNQDGHTNGITVPSKEAQKKLIRKVYEENGVNKEDIHYVEAHGTGTPVGDPIEFSVLNEALSEERDPKSKCLVGSVKTNIGHLEAASGVAGLIKTALCLNKNSVPANLHFNTPNPALNYEESILKVPTSLEKLPQNLISYASINSFGYGGTNAHAVLKQVPLNTSKKTYNLEKEDHFIFPICARSNEALKELVTKYKNYLQNGNENFPQVISNAIYRRSHHSDRLAIVASSKDELLEKIEAFEEDILVKGVVKGNVQAKNPEVVFVYTGMGPQWWKMGLELMETEPVFYKAVKECDIEFEKISGWSIMKEMKKPEEISKIKETYIAQPANLIIQIALTRLLEHYGVVPNAVVGHSVGEVASTYISGALSLKEALLVSYQRSRLQHKTAGTGTMLAVGLSEFDVKDSLKNYKDVSIAAINSPGSVTLAGKKESLEELEEYYETMGVFHRLLEVTVPYHSPMMEPIKENLLDCLNSLKGKETNIDLYSTVTADKISGENINNKYWWKNVREPVRFSKTMDSLVRDKYKVFIEIGPHPVLKNSMKECIKNQDSFQLLQTLNRKVTEQLNFFENISTLFTLGYQINWERWVAKLPHLSLPSYPWQKENYWRESDQSIQDRIGGERSVFLNEKIHSPQLTYSVELNKYFFPFMNDHIVQDNVVFPGAGYIAAGIALYQEEISKQIPFGLENIKFHQLLVIDDHKIQDLYTSYDSKSNHFSIHSNDVGNDTQWIKRSTGKFIVGNYTKSASSIDVKSILTRLKGSFSEEEVYAKLSKAKLEYGPYFRAIKEIKYEGNEIVAKIIGHPIVKEMSEEYFIHPILLDACFQSTIAFDSSEFVPVSVGKMYFYFTPGEELICYANLISRTANAVIIDMKICDSEGNVAIEIKDFKCQSLVTSQLDTNNFIHNCLYENDWFEENVNIEKNPNTSGITYIFADDYSSCIQLIEKLEGKVTVLQPGSSFKELSEDHYIIDIENLDSISKFLGNDLKSDLTLIYMLKNDTLKEVSIVSEKCLKQINPLLEVVQFFSRKSENKFTLNLITKGTQVVTKNDKILSIESTVVHGLGRLIGNELSKWKIRLIDFEANNCSRISESEWGNVLNKMYNSTKPFEEIAVREDKVYRKGMKEWEEKNTKSNIESIQFKNRALKLMPPDYNDIENLYFGRTERRVPKADEIEILIESSAISFKDYLKISNKVSSEIIEGTYGENSLGLDCVGIITKIGSEVTKFNVGDKVIAIAAGTFQSFTITSENLAIKCPEKLKGTDANIALNYLITLYSLKEKASLTKGEKILIHNATEGVGLAAINYANMIGAEVYATVDTEEKQNYLKSIGVSNIYNFKSLDFSKEILVSTKGKGVDVILSDLPKETLHQSMSILAPYGRYLEIGKKDIIDNTLLSMSFFNKNISYISVDIDQVLKDKQEVISILFKDLLRNLESGVLQPIPNKVFTPKEISKAFELVESTTNIGNVIINFKNQFIEIKEEDVLFKTDKTYLITGGTKGLGLEIGKWLVDNGVKNLALLSRSGLKDSHTKKEVNQMKERGVNVKVYSVDVSELDQMAKVFSQIKKELPEIVSIFHCAMVLDDGFLIDMNEDRFRKVLRPKVNGATNIHHLSKGLNLDNFVLFSSISSLIGNVGQANYIVANALLDSFANLRKSMGLPATTINLGVLAESGVVSRSENLEMILQGVGIRSFTNEQVLLGLEKILREKPTQVGFFDLNWEVLSNNLQGSGLSIFQELIKDNVNSNSELSNEQSEFLNEMLSLETQVQYEFVKLFLKEALSKMLKLPKDKIQSDKGIGFLGIDSILSVELLRIINNKFSLKMTSMELLALPSVNQLSTMVINKVVEGFDLEGVKI
ncbi:SDR family NAD(P)-dependent oxidoreductase [Tenacibaculum halocynthiae]|uniref:SDR family NAD(P)-dependent oxidoreductase n=1 Tax=Tenacibaculum halocynthiae TaxID=1254437 RepID=UPI003893F1D0